MAVEAGQWGWLGPPAVAAVPNKAGLLSAWLKLKQPTQANISKFFFLVRCVVATTSNCFW